MQSPLGTRGCILFDSNLPSPKEVPRGLRADYRDLCAGATAKVNSHPLPWGN